MTTVRHFAQYRIDPFTDPDTFLGMGSVPLGSTYGYRNETVWCVAINDWCIEMTVNGVHMKETNFNPFVAWTTPFMTAWDGETTYLESDVPGVSTAKAHFSNMQVQRYTDDLWQTSLPALFTSSPTSSRYKKTAVSGNAFDIWVG